MFVARSFALNVEVFVVLAINVLIDLLKVDDPNDIRLVVIIKKNCV